jgi:hypothetical protein
MSLEAVAKELEQAGVTQAERPIAWADSDDLPIVQVDLAALERAAGTEQLPDRAAMRDTYKRLRGLDDGLR